MIHRLNTTRISLKEKRLIFFADDDSKKPSQDKLQGTWEGMATEMSEKYSQFGGDKIVQLYKDGKISQDLFDDLYRVIRDPNKTKKDGYSNFLKCVAEGKFQQNSKKIDQLLSSLSGSTDEQKYINEVVRKLSDNSSSELSNDQIDQHIEKLKSLKRRTETADATSSGASAITSAERAITLNEVREITSLNDDNWHAEKPPKDLIEKLDNGEIEIFKLAKGANKNDLEIRGLDKELARLTARSVVDSVVVRKLKEKIEGLKQALGKIDTAINDKRLELKDAKDQWKKWISRSLNRYRAIKKFSAATGISLDKAKDLAILFSRQGKNGKTQLSIQGIEVNKETGKAERKMIPLTIHKLFFDNQKDNLEGTSPGELIVEYELGGENPERSQSTYKNFINLLNAFEGYEVINSNQELEEKYGFELGYKNVEDLVGEEFEREVLNLEDGKKVRTIEKFKISAITKNSNGETIIETENAVTKRARHELPLTMDASGYFDRKAQKFSLGEFGAMIRERRYQRVVATEDMQSVLNKMAADSNREAESFVAGSTQEVQDRFKAIGGGRVMPFILPNIGEEKPVAFKDKDGRRKHGVLRRELDEKGNDRFIFKANHSGADGSRQMNAPNLPNHEGLNADAPYNPNAKEEPFEEVKSASNFLKATKNGDIQELEEAPPADNLDEENFDDDNGQPEGNDGESKGRTKKSYKEEALPYADIHHLGGMQMGEDNFIKAMWSETRFFSVDDFWEMGKAMYEYYIRRFERDQKGRYSEIGQDLPYFAPEMRRINQATETEMVNQYKEAFDQKGIFEVEDRLINTSQPDELKAAISTLCEKGQMRWENIDFWRNVNNFVPPDKQIPLPINGDYTTILDDGSGRTGMDFIKDALDSIWGEGGYNDWFSQNKSQYASNLKGYYEEGSELEGLDGGHGRRLGELLRQHKNGEYVDPHEYEGLVQHAIEAGKSNITAKLYYMIQGVGFVNRDGRTILPADRMAHINSDQLARFPILEYLCASVERSDGKSHKYTQADYKEWVKIFDAGNSMNTEPTKETDDFLWKYIVPSDENQNRINKDLRNGENLDHDDMYVYLPPATEEVITDTCKSTVGSKKFLTIEGYANVIPGMSQYMRTLSANGNRDKLLEAVKSYVRFSGIMTNKFEKSLDSSRDQFQRLGDKTLRSAPIMSPTPPLAFIDQTNEVLRKVIASYGDEVLIDISDKVFGEEIQDLHVQGQKDKQQQVNSAFKRFGREFQRVVASDGGAKMTHIINAANLEGMDIIHQPSDADRAAKKAQLTDDYALDY